MNSLDLAKSLRQKGFSEAVISAFAKVQREKFVPEQYREYAYEDVALPLEDGSSLSQPYTIAFMLSLLEPKYNQKILEIGSGSGYALALISEIIKNGKIIGLELSKTLAVKSKTILSKDTNVQILNRSGFEGFAEQAPYDRILISASCSDMRIPYVIAEQLSDNGIMVSPVQTSIWQFKKTAGKLEQKEFQGFAFVPLRKE